MFNYWLRFDEKFLNALPHRKNDNWSKERKTHAKWSVTRCDIGRKLLCILKTSEKNHKIWNVSKIRSHSLDNSCPCSRIVFRLYLAFLSIAKKKSLTQIVWMRCSSSFTFYLSRFLFHLVHWLYDKAIISSDQILQTVDIFLDSIE